ncbi:transposase [Pseudenhygromyxa sp. WMMC2535]|nr:transposase [Pseudenhygromyxa sp. WMMC2535]
MGRSERREALANYMRGLLLDGERKSMVPIAQRLAAAPGDSEAIRQRLQQAITIADWDEWELFRRLALRVEDKLRASTPSSSTTPASPRRASTPSGYSVSTRGRWGRVDIARSQQASTSPARRAALASACAQGAGPRQASPRSSPIKRSSSSASACSTAPSVGDV